MMDTDSGETVVIRRGSEIARKREQTKRIGTVWAERVRNSIVADAAAAALSRRTDS
jgi:hypothetical protein